MHNISQASTPDELNGVRRLMRDFVAWHKTRHAQYRGLIDKYFGAGAFEAELDNLPGHYAPLRREARDLKEVVAEQTLELRLLKESMTSDGDDQE